MKTFKITTSTIAYTFKDVLTTFIFGVMLLGILTFGFTPEDYSDLYLVIQIVAIGFVFMMLLPNLILLWNYLDAGINDPLTVFDDRLEFGDKTISLDDIQHLQIIGTYQHFNPPVSVSTLPYNDYFYYIKMTTKHEEIFYFTSLYGYKFDKELKKMLGEHRFENKISSFPMI